MAVAKWILDVDGARLCFQVMFNGILLAQDVARERLSRAFRLNGWALQGDNQVQVMLAALPPVSASPPAAGSSPSAVLRAPAPPLFRLRLRELVAGAAERVLAQYEWDVATMPLPISGSSPAFAQTVTLSPLAAWAWTRAEAVPRLSDNDVAEIGQLLTTLRTALLERNATELLRLQGPALAEQAMSVGDDARVIQQGYAQFLSDRMGAADWSVRRLNLDGLSMQPMAGGRLVHVTDSAGLPPVAADCGESTFAIDPWLAKLAGRWVIVR